MSFSVPVSAVAAIAAGSNNTSLRFDAGALGAFTLHNPSLKDISAKGGDILVSSIIRGDNEAAINITIDGVLLSKIVGGIRVALPGLAKGEVIILVNTDSGEEVVKKSVVDSGDVYALIGGSGTIKVINNSKIFADVSSANWFYNSVAFVNSRGLFVGVSDTEFAPNMPMTRAMLATVLHRLEDNEHLGAGTVFSDVPAKEWYSDGVTWVSSAGIVSGYGNGAFGANDSITREQLAVMLCNYANYIDMNTIERGDTGRFADAGFTAAWANDAVRWAVGVGIMHGDGTNLNPKGEATRAEVATMIMRFISVLVK